MEDRLVQYPNRVQLIQVEGQPGIYDIVPMPGTITSEGTPLNKLTLLSDSVAELLGSPATPSEAFERLAKRVQPIKLGGTGATTVEEILANLGIADYIVEQGTSGIWTYKKWASGEAELRATFVTTTAYPITTAYGNVYCYNAPFNIAFSGVPFSFVDYDADSEIFVTIRGDGMDFSGGASLSSGNALTFYWMNPTSYTAKAGAKIQIIIKGRWK